ncbi:MULTISPECIES: ComEA family DNA-binding protein [unclassified Pseudomonas]|uniref:ComEA family DNA-binding protein n=1 Tax=unclassified Pseudomonas TaxID=196821 RepID=UPI0021CA58B9|nr:MULTISPECIES: ComEA family DNA-binding protein [unclassified Pseudomonas]MCU1733968.1 helix-hairpin-helix domain-containing protein [Pseudomonas sp. 20P_3.2_Bac4]MCU1742364.1 helix-hairpin-helix domain-containing protein [Pseudomonas sp. 20P_3.2_Bac5]
MTQHYITSILAAVAMTFSLVASGTPTSPAGASLSEAMVVELPVAEKLNLNSADAPTLQRELSGIGKTKAQAIINYRERNGDFASVDELLEVEGIGKALVDRNRDKITVN